MFPALLAAIPALMSLFGGAGAATAGAAGAGAAGAGAGAAGGAAGGLGGLLGGLFGGASGGAAAGGAATTAAEALPELAGAGSSGGFLGGAPAAGGAASGGGGMGGIFGQLLGQGGGGQQQGGGNMMNDLLGGPGRAYMVGAQAGKGDFKGAQQMMDQHSAVVDRQNRTDLLGQANTREQGKFDTDQATAARKQRAIDKLSNVDFDALQKDPVKFFTSNLGNLVDAGGGAIIPHVMDAITKMQTSKQDEAAMKTVGGMFSDAFDPKTGEYDNKKGEVILGGIMANHPELHKAVKGYMDTIMPTIKEGRMTDQQGLGTAGMRDMIALVKPGAKSIDELDENQKNDVMQLRGASGAVKDQLLAQRRSNPNAPLDINKAIESSNQNKISVAVNVAGQGAAARAAGTERGLQSVQAQRLNRIRGEAEARNDGAPLAPAVAEKVSNLMSFRNIVGQVEDNLDAEFLGPVKGTASAFEARRRVGTFAGSPLGEKETIFRQSLSDMSDMLLRARSGAQINEQEFRRLSAMLPKATDEYTVFKAGLARIDQEMEKLTGDKIRLGATPRGKLNDKGERKDTGTGGGWSIKPR